ncbi:peptide-methionine (S)-S-oxide reductase MsrA [Parasediminibacterium sp. JCM 36343]|uniref:peptide-methionine (S)-S-oxide reductase MsrA n=1 Tax=Parasediminibacterium sp. JCM 36343 TaxID=3374279 RepID=UPI003979B580
MMQKLLFSGIMALCVLASCAQKQTKKDMSETKTDPNVKTATAYFGEGCFWCTEAFFQRIEGVVSVRSGYGGGHVENPTYEQVCDKNTGHAEVTKIEYDPAKVSYEDLLEVFWKTHDPTTMNQQGNDVGPQYRSVIFYLNDEQKEKAIHYKAALDASHAYAKPIVTAIEPFKNYYPAEDYHQNYYNDHPGQGYCSFVIRPKVEKFEKVFKHKLKKEN